MKNQLMIQSYENTTKYLEQVGAIRHEMKNHVEALRILMDGREYKKTQEYLLRLSERQEQVPQARYCDHYLLNAILSVHISRLKESGVRVSHYIVPAKELNVPDEDLSSLVINLLDNAEEALAGMGTGADKWLELKIYTKKPYLYVFCENAKVNPIQESDGEYLSSKRDKETHGYGLKIIRRIVKKRDGLLSISYTANTFSIVVAIKEGAE